MDLKELIKLADALDDTGKRELIYFLQSRTKGIAVPVPIINEIQEQKHKDGLVCPHCNDHSVVRFGKYDVKTGSRIVKRQRIVVSRAVKRLTILRKPRYNEHEDPLFGFDSSNT